MSIERPKGDPSAICLAANALGRLADDLAAATKIADRGMTVALRHWESTRAEMFVSAAMPGDIITAVTVRELRGAYDVLLRYASKLDAAQSDPRFGEYQLVVDEMIRLGPGNGNYHELEREKEERGRELQRINDELAEEAERAEANILSGVGRCSIPSTSPTPKELLSYIEKVGNTLNQRSETYAKVVSVMNLAQAPMKFKGGVTAADAWRAERKASMLLRGSQRSQVQYAEFMGRVFGKGSTHHIKAWRDAQHAVNANQKDLNKKSAAAKVAREEYVKALRPMTALSRLNAAVGIHDSYKTMKKPAEGARGKANRAFAAAGMTAGILELSLIVLPMSGPLAPVVGTVALVLGVSAAAWEIGSLVYDNRQAIKRSVESPADLGKEIARDCRERGLLNCPDALDRKASFLDRLRGHIPSAR